MKRLLHFFGLFPSRRAFRRYLNQNLERTWLRASRNYCPLAVWSGYRIDQRHFGYRGRLPVWAQEVVHYIDDPAATSNDISGRQVLQILDYVERSA